MSVKYIWQKIRHEAAKEASFNFQYWSCPVHIVEGNQLPQVAGEHARYIDRQGNTVRRTNSNFRRLTYIKSSVRIQVGKEWLFDNLTDEEIAEIIADKLGQ